MNAPEVEESNAVECYDCDEIYKGESECPEDPSGHGWHPVFITDVALGYDDDQDMYHHGIKRYVYDAK